MGRMHTHRHGKSHSIRPATLRVPSWVTLSPKEVEELIIKYSIGLLKLVLFLRLTGTEGIRV